MVGIHIDFPWMVEYVQHIDVFCKAKPTAKSAEPCNPCNYPNMVGWIKTSWALAYFSTVRWTQNYPKTVVWIQTRWERNYFSKEMCFQNYPRKVVWKYLRIAAGLTLPQRSGASPNNVDKQAPQ